MCNGQNRKLKGPAKKRQTNSHFPKGRASGSVKKYIRVNSSHTAEVGIPRQPVPRPRLSLRCSLVSNIPFPAPYSLSYRPVADNPYSRSSWRAMVWRWISEVPS